MHTHTLNVHAVLVLLLLLSNDRLGARVRVGGGAAVEEYINPSEGMRR